MVVQHWWASFGLADHRAWTFAAFAVILLQTVLRLANAPRMEPPAR